MKRHTAHIWKRYKRYVVGVAAALLLLGAGYIGHYIYTGKGWLLLSGKETLADFYFNRGEYYFGGGAYDTAVAETNFEKALVRSPQYPLAHYQLARINFIQGHFSTALVHADAELLLYPEHFRVHYLKGLIYGYRKQYIQAEEEFKLFIAQEPYQSWAGHNDLAWIYFAEGNYKEAAAIAWKGLEAHPQAPYSGWLENSYGVAEMNLGNYKTAQTYLTLAAEHFGQMTEKQWGVAYPGNNPEQYGGGLAQTRAAIQQNLSIVHSKLGEE